MNKSKELLPLGSIVYLEEGTQKLVIVGRGAIFEDPDTKEQVLDRHSFQNRRKLSIME